MNTSQEARPAGPISGPEVRRHLADALVPNIAFIVCYELFGVPVGVTAAIIAGLVLVVLRLARKQKLKVVIAAFAVVLLHAATVVATGEGRDYFLPWLTFNIALTVVFAGSLVIGKPLTARLMRTAGLAAGPARHKKVTALWTGLCALHLLVGLPLYSADMVVALGVAKFVLGPPAFLLLGVVSWRMLTRVPAAASDGGRAA